MSLHLITFPARLGYARANPQIREVAPATRTSLIDLEAVFEPICPDRACPRLLFPDNHPREQGYRVVAEAIARHLGRE